MKYYKTSGNKSTESERESERGKGGGEGGNTWRMNCIISKWPRLTRNFNPAATACMLRTIQ